MLPHELQRRRVHAVAQPRWLGTVLKHMPQVSATAAARHLGPPHEPAVIRVQRDVILDHRLRIEEEEAFARLRRLASDTNRKLVEVALTVLAAEDVFHTLER